MKEILSKKVIMSVLAFVMASGGYGGYQVFKDDIKYGVNFENRLHTVEEVVDGDTIVIEDGIRVRLLGIDSPEKGECFADEAKQELSARLLGREVVLEKDQSGEDNYDRLLRYVFLNNENPESDNIFVNKEMVRDGYAQSSYVKPNKRYLAVLQAAQREAQDEKVGMWEKCGIEVEENNEREMGVESFNDECVIKGNIDKSYEKYYFVPGCPNYKRVKIDPRKGERWFCSEDEAVEAGWEKSAACGNIWQTR